MAITTLNNRSINRSDTASSGQLWTATSATASDFQSSSAANTPAFEAVYGGGTYAISSATYTLAQYGTEIFDSDGEFASHIFTPQTAGKYFLHANAWVYMQSTAAQSTAMRILFYKNGSADNDTETLVGMGDADMQSFSLSTTSIVTANGSTDNWKVYVKVATNDATYYNGSFGGFKIIGA